MNRIYEFLKSNEIQGNLIKGLKVLDPRSSRAENIIERLIAFNPEGVNSDSLLNQNNSYSNQPNPEWYVYRKFALLAINQYILDFPFLMHTPSSLRAVFGMPTRKDRKRGKFSGKELIESALSGIDDFSQIINYETVFELQDCLKSVMKNQSKFSSECNILIEYLDKNLTRNSLLETFTPEISTHSVDSLEKGKIYLQSFGFQKVIHEAENEYPYVDENKVLTPDFICTIWNSLVWFELKEWTNFNNFLSPIKQLLTYLLFEKGNNSSYIGILVENKVDFFNFLEDFESDLTFSKLKSALIPYIDEVKSQSDKIHNMRNDYLKIGKLMIEKYNMQIKAETLYIGLFSEFINKELGMINSEMDAGRTILEIIEKLEKESKEILIIPIEQLPSIKSKPKHKFIIFLGSLNSNTESEDNSSMQ